MEQSIQILTSCTGRKARASSNALTWEDFREEDEYIRTRERELQEEMLPAREMYTGRQHEHLMKGVQTLRGSEEAVSVDVSIVSAGYGVVDEERMVAPYDLTFSEMSRREARSWAREQGIPSDVRKTLRKNADVHIVLLGTAYLDAARLIGGDREDWKVSGRALFLCSRSAAKGIGGRSGCLAVGLTNDHAREWGEGLVGLKGLIARQLLLARASGEAILSDEEAGGAEAFLNRLHDSKDDRPPSPFEGQNLEEIASGGRQTRLFENGS